MNCGPGTAVALTKEEGPAAAAPAPYVLDAGKGSSFRPDRDLGRVYGEPRAVQTLPGWGAAARPGSVGPVPTAETA